MPEGYHILIADAPIPRWAPGDYTITLRTRGAIQATFGGIHQPAGLLKIACNLAQTARLVGIETFCVSECRGE